MAFKGNKKPTGQLVPSSKSKAVSKKTLSENNLYHTRYFSSTRVPRKNQHFGGNSEMSEADGVVCQNAVSKEWENVYAGGYM